MPDYVYLAQTTAGGWERGQIAGDSPADARALLMAAGRRLVNIREMSGWERLVQAVGAVVKRPRQRALGGSDAETLLQQLAVMLDSGLELAPALRELSRHSSRRRAQGVCATVARQIEQGRPLELALEETRAYPPLVIRLVRVGEQTGELAAMLQRGARHMETRRRTRGKMLAATAYPVVVALAACGVAVYLVGWAIPKLATFLHTLGRELPPMTQSLIGLSMVIQRYGSAIAVAVIALGVALALIYRWQRGRAWIDRGILRVPVLGTLLRMSETEQFASATALMLRSGVLLPDAMHTMSLLHRNAFLSEQVRTAKEGLVRGRSLSTCLNQSGFAPLLASGVAVGERTGDLARALEHVATFYASQVESRVQRMTRLVEPAIIVVVGGIVGYVYIAFFMALLSAGGNFR